MEQRLSLDVELNLHQAGAEGPSRWSVKIRWEFSPKAHSLAFKCNTNYWAKLATHLNAKNKFSSNCIIRTQK